MKHLLKLSMGSTLLLIASSLSVGEDAQGYSTLGFSISLSQRDARLFNNFNDLLSNDNVSSHANWPEYDGAELAIWKAAYEWGADAFGDGSGDSTQSIVGSGGGNFTPVWNGNASGSGSGWRNNIVHAPNISGGGAIAWAYPSPNGWLIEFADKSFTFADGPNDISWPEMDIQGVGCHEYGHALGLDHASAPSATMYYSIQAGSTDERSITTDDSNGLQSIYGIKDPAMPYITGILGSTVPGATAVVVGGNFSGDCRLWFNSDLLDNTDQGGEIYKLNGLTSTGGGTQIPFTVPTTGIEGGAIHAKITGGKESLSEGHPLALNLGSISNTLALVGPTSANAGENVLFSFTGARPQVYFELNRSSSLNGHKIGGHYFDLGRRVVTVRTGITTTGGTATGTKRLPLTAAGFTIYIEAVTLDGGIYEDSNPIQLQIF